MSSPEDDTNGDSPSVGQEQKKRRIQRACDICRRKKIRCDGSQMPGNRCSNCNAYNFECTYIEAAKKRGPPKGYVESLENRLEKMERLLQTMCPDSDFTQELGGQLDKESWVSDARKRTPNIEKSNGSRRSSRAGSPSSRGTLVVGNALNSPLSTDDLVPSDDDVGGLIPCEEEPKQERFHGKSSGMKLIQDVVILKREYTGYDTKNSAQLHRRRPEFWSPNIWEAIPTQEVQYDFPPNDLLAELVDLYFIYMNPYFPLLHRPSFERAIRDRRHYADHGFATVVLLVCALGARWSDDPRVFLDVGQSKAHSAGWMYFSQTNRAHKSLITPPRLYDLQMFTLASMYMFGCSTPQVSWTISGMAIRLAQDVGAHRRKVYNPTPSIESELWKRAFWVLISLDRIGSAALGRPCAIQDEDFDLDLPLEVDDEYWEHPDPTKAFKQPEGVPSTISYFAASLKLAQISAFALRTIYSINKSKILLGFVGTQWEQHIVAELDSALNKWLDTVPDHLRWDPHRENLEHFGQSAALYASYYHLQILIHRPFIPSPRKPSPLTFPSLAICTNAARSCSHVADLLAKRDGVALAPLQVAVFTSGVVLLLNIWGARKTGVNVAPAQQMADVQKCMALLRTLEKRWQSAGRLWDILNELAHAGDVPLPSPNATFKRDRHSENSMFVTGHLQQPLPSTMVDNAHRPIAGRKSLNANSFPLSPPTGSSSSQTSHTGHTPPSLALNSEYPPPPIEVALPTVSSSGDISGMWAKRQQQREEPPLVPSQAPPQQRLFNPSNVNLFDFFHADAGGPGSGVPAAQPYATDVSREQPQTMQNQFIYDGNAANTAYAGQQMGPPLSTDFSSGFTETLQMWSSTAAGFDFGEWAPYMQSMAGARGDQEPAYDPNFNQAN